VPASAVHRRLGGYLRQRSCVRLAAGAAVATNNTTATTAARVSMRAAAYERTIVVRGVGRRRKVRAGRAYRRGAAGGTRADVGSGGRRDAVVCPCATGAACDLRGFASAGKRSTAGATAAGATTVCTQRPRLREAAPAVEIANVRPLSRRLRNAWRTDRWLRLQPCWPVWLGVVAAGAAAVEVVVATTAYHGSGHFKGRRRRRRRSWQRVVTQRVAAAGQSCHCGADGDGCCRDAPIVVAVVAIAVAVAVAARTGHRRRTAAHYVSAVTVPNAGKRRLLLS
jgi:hypothetical protein